jgi:hypothetical protein
MRWKIEHTEATEDLGLLVALVTESVLDTPGVLVGVRGVTFVIGIVGNGIAFVGVVGLLLPVTVDRSMKAIEAELGVDFESGCDPEGIIRPLRFLDKHHARTQTGIDAPSHANNIRPNRQRRRLPSQYSNSNSAPSSSEYARA